MAPESPAVPELKRTIQGATTVTLSAPAGMMRVTVPLERSCIPALLLIHKLDMSPVAATTTDCAVLLIVDA